MRVLAFFHPGFRLPFAPAPFAGYLFSPFRALPSNVPLFVALSLPLLRPSVPHSFFNPTLGEDWFYFRLPASRSLAFLRSYNPFSSPLCTLQLSSVYFHPLRPSTPFLADDFLFVDCPPLEPPSPSLLVAFVLFPSRFIEIPLVASSLFFPDGVLFATPGHLLFPRFCAFIERP